MILLTIYICPTYSIFTPYPPTIYIHPSASTLEGTAYEQRISASSNKSRSAPNPVFINHRSRSCHRSSSSSRRSHTCSCAAATQLAITHSLPASIAGVPSQSIYSFTSENSTLNVARSQSVRASFLNTAWHSGITKSLYSHSVLLTLLSSAAVPRPRLATLLGPAPSLIAGSAARQSHCGWKQRQHTFSHGIHLFFLLRHRSITSVFARIHPNRSEHVPAA